jgi:hypothetical protein
VKRPRALVASLVAALAAAVFGWLWAAPFGTSREVEPRARPTPATDEPEITSRTRAPITRPPPRDSQKAPSAACAPRARRECHAGDVYWIDSCDARSDKAEECGARLCQGEACEETDAHACAGLPAEGLCDGDVVRGCLAGWPFERDCGALGKRCVKDVEGAVCRKPAADDCDPATPPRCAGQVLVSCVEGKQVARDCNAMNARCETVRHTGVPACVAVRELDRAPREHDTCGPCGCIDDAPRFEEETCNGADDDGDERIDEEARCEPLEVVAFVVTDATGASSYSQVDIEQEIARLDAAFAQGSAGLSMHVALAEVVELARPEYLQLDADTELNALIGELSQSALLAPSLGARVPLVFTDEVLVEEVPKAGIATLPNGYCGGLRLFMEPQPLRGLVAVAKRRAPTTLAHELGHFLGLCHTHETHSEPVVRVGRWRDASGGYETTCDATCTLEGDGICDTPLDPGPTSCRYDTRCDAQCAGGEAPSTRNLMSYYTECRSELTPWQTVELARTRALLDGWLRCAEPSACPCALQDERTDACPEQMSCRPTAQGLACTLDGVFLAGERCRAHAECGAGLVCFERRCTPAAQLGGRL